MNDAIAIRDDALAALGLPKIAYYHSAEDGIVVIMRGESGYRLPTNLPPAIDDPAQFVDGRNRAMGVSPAQREAMFAGSAFGWRLPIADPKFHAEAG